jgi:hypothetical protein
MDQRLVCLFLALKELSARAVSDELTAALGADAIAYSTVAKYLRHRQLMSIIVRLLRGTTTIVFDQAILDALEHYSFSSIRELARLTCIPTKAVHRHLTQSLRLVVRHLR